MALIQLTAISKSFQDGENRQNCVLRHVDLKVEAGAFVAIRGQSGTGKTTLLSILGTLLPPDSGSYWLDGQDMTTAQVDHALVRNKQIGFVFQDHRLMPQCSALENVLLPTLAFATEASQSQLDYARQLMELTHIAHLAKQYPGTLSGGEASRVAVCRALIMKPLLLLADEPTGQLDAENARHIALLLADINKQLNTTIVMVTHSEETSAVAHHTYMLKGGTIQ